MRRLTISLELPGRRVPVVTLEWSGGEPATANPGPARGEQPMASTRYQIGTGGDGANRQFPECPVCYARGGGGHGGFCPNAGGKSPDQWAMTPPAGYLRPDYPEGRIPWTS